MNQLEVESNQGGKALNDLQAPNHTNIHTHGLHVDPAVDNAMLPVAPGANRTYRWLPLAGCTRCDAHGSRCAVGVCRGGAGTSSVGRVCQLHEGARACAGGAWGGA